MNSSLTNSVTEWTTVEVSRFLQQALPKKYPIDISKAIQRHGLTGLDLLELTEQNLQELGVGSIHDRKGILRGVKAMKNSAQSGYGIIQVKMFDSISQVEKKMQLKIIEGQTKVKHILRQGLEAFTQKKCDLSHYCLVQTNCQRRLPLVNTNQISQIVMPSRLEEFEICKVQDMISISLCPSTISSPIRVMRPNVDNSLERIVTSPIEKIYVQPTDDNNEEMVQMMVSSTEQLQSQRKTQRPSTATKSVSQAMLKKSKGPTNNSSSNASTNRDSTQSGPTNYLQNYITSNKLSNKKSFNQLHQNSQSSQQTQSLVPAFNQFQVKKHSVNETAMNYSNPISQATINLNTFNQTQVPSGQSLASGSLSRGNSIKKMRTISGGQGNHPSNKTSQVHNMSTQQTQYSINHQTLSNNSRGKKSNQKGVKPINMYQTLNGNSTQPHNSNQTIQHQQNVITRHETMGAQRPIGIQQISDEFVKIINQGCQVQQDPNRLEKTPKDQRNTQDIVSKSGGNLNGKKSSGSFKQSFVQAYSQQQAPQPKNDAKQQKQINNLNEIFSDFLDEQQIQSTSTKKHLSSKVRAESQSQLSRQQVLLDEDSLESTKRKLNPSIQNPQQTINQGQSVIPSNMHAFTEMSSCYPLYEKTHHNQQYDGGFNYGSQESLGDNQHQLSKDKAESSSQLGHHNQMQNQTQRAVKHMQHKSMYALNSTQARQKKQQYVTNSSAKTNMQQHYGTFDNTAQGHEFQQTMNDFNSECQLQYEDQMMKENYNMTNMQFNPGEYKASAIGTARLNTDVDYCMNNDEKENYGYKGKIGGKITDILDVSNGLGRRGGTMQNTNNTYVRSDSNPTKHKNNRYSEQCDDMLMMDMSEEESLIIKQKF